MFDGRVLNNGDAGVSCQRYNTRYYKSALININDIEYSLLVDLWQDPRFILEECDYSASASINPLELIKSRMAFLDRFHRGRVITRSRAKKNLESIKSLIKSGMSPDPSLKQSASEDPCSLNKNVSDDPNLKQRWVSVTRILVNQSLILKRIRVRNLVNPYS